MYAASLKRFVKKQKGRADARPFRLPIRRAGIQPPDALDA